MTIDRTARTPLWLIALALWGLLLRPALVSTPARAQDAGAPAPARCCMQVVNGGLYLYHQNGNVYRFDPTTLRLLAQAIYSGQALSLIHI